MTKLKNTKKGMAKKALSVSLVAAMLATSNVPVWAAEDLFTDGSNTSNVELFSAAPAEEIGDASTLSATEATFVFQQNGQTVMNEAVVKDGTLTVVATLNEAIKAGESAVLYLYDGTSTEPKEYKEFTEGNVLSYSYTLKNQDVGKTFRVVVGYKASNATEVEIGSARINIVDSATVLTGTPVIDAGETDNIALGTTLTANTDDMGPEGTEFKFQWQVTDADGKWTNIDNATNQAYAITDSTYYGHQIRVAVYTGTAYEETKARFSASVTVGARELNDSTAPNGRIHIGNTNTLIETNMGTNNKEKVFSTESKQNELTDKDIMVQYINLAGRIVPLTYGVDYTLTYSQLYHLGQVIVTVNILPTAATDYTKDTYTADSLNYTLVPGTELTDYHINYSVDAYEYTGQKITPKVSSVTYTDKQGDTVTLPTSDYTVQEIGPNVGDYPLSVYVEDRGLVYVKDGINVDADAVEVTKKVMGDHDSDFTVEIPEQVWSADGTDVEANTVEDAQIKMYDTAADPSKTNDLLASGQFEIKVVNWNNSSIKKSIKIIALNTAENYTGSIIRDGEVTKSDINSFKADFLNALAPGNNLVYNGVEQDYLNTLLYSNGNYGSITLSGEQLFLNRDFTYEITQGGTNAGYVSYTIKGAGVYADTEMVLSNAYKIQPAVFKTDVTDNREAGNIISVPFNPSLGDKGADIRNYEVLGQDVYEAWMTETDYELTLNKDFWLDSDTIGKDRIQWTPTVAENKVAGHGKNENFRQDASATKTPIIAELVEKNLGDSDISVQIVDAAYNNGNPVIPEVKVIYTAKDGKEYEISDDYYDVEILRSAVNEGDTGRINIVAKDNEDPNWDSEKYPQLYTGNQIMDFTVGTPSLEGGQILATNGLETLPSVAYDAEQASSSQGIILPEGQYIVKDKSGNVVDPRYYDVTFSNNKAAGTATITVTGKAPYEGSVSANFTITTAMLPSGTVTLMSDDLAKAYTGEEIHLVKGTDYTITGEFAQLTEGTDYMIVYENAVNVTSASSKAQIKFVGIGSYAGELVKTFDITPAKITAEDVTLGDTTYAGGKTIEPSVTITIPGGNTTLVEGTDYTVDYVPAATNVGDTGKVVITYNEDNKNINGADSVKEVEYGVTAKDLKDVTIAPIGAQEATGEQIKPELSVMNGSVELTEGVDYEVSYGENTEVGVGTVTITAAADNKNYTGTQTIEFSIIEAVPEVGQAVISNIRVSGNTVTPVLSGDVDGAVGYDYVISTSDDVTDTASRVDVSKNILNTNTNFYYVEAGTYYVYCHAWMRDENGLKVFGDWSNVMPVEVTAVTPERPMIQSAKLKGNTLTVTWSRSANATGYDIVMGKAARKVNGEMRPVDYGKAVKKITNGNTVTVTFRSIPKGTYYVGLHAWNRTSESSAKVFSPWSNGRKVVVK